ncbi:hypothetical protein [Nitratidesulfovibrio liaohensis]|uniref:Uncharacterized protein n=1 Tax=Nitratidesulfovibrio liaohensis TaxID=2604158 RepID=A0ABY9R6X9_9BACT|nr:hypothetical protein [Nitratidesulfovibrio liaohensis]WMW66798.1 hypothetical protein KPS_001413 [Nitratidesulfovibrio liaohensis]
MTLACSIGSDRVAARRFAGSLRRLISSDDRREHDLALSGRLGPCGTDGADDAHGSDEAPRFSAAATGRPCD